VAAWRNRRAPPRSRPKQRTWCTDWGFGTGIRLNETNGALCGYNATRYDGVRFMARSGKGPTSARFQIGLRRTIPKSIGGDGSCERPDEKTCYDYHGVSIELTTEWKALHSSGPTFNRRGGARHRHSIRRR